MAAKREMKPRTVYSMDRRGFWRPGEIFNLRSPDFDFLDAHIITIDKELLSREFDKGISAHGQDYLLANGVGDGADLKSLRSTLMELVWELVRRKDFPLMPSRFTCIFGCDRVEEVESFSKKYGGIGPIYEVIADTYYKLDMSWLAWASPTTQLWSNAFNYWSGASSSQPFWEYLVPLPAKIGKVK
jgi:hypothetical protein